MYSTYDELIGKRCHFISGSDQGALEHMITHGQNGIMPILVVEDDEIDAEALTRAFAKQNIKNPVFKANDGVEALQMLEGSGAFPPIPQPCLVIMDINMPRMNGLELLEAMNKHDLIYGNVVIVLTTSSREEDKIRAYQSRAAGYFLKENLPELSIMISQYCKINELPHTPRTPGRDYQ